MLPVTTCHYILTGVRISPAVKVRQPSVSWAPESNWDDEDVRIDSKHPMWISEGP